MNVTDVMRRATARLAKDPAATMQMHLPWTVKDQDLMTLFKDGTGPIGKVIASGPTGTIAEFKAKDVLAACHSIKAAA